MPNETATPDGTPAGTVPFAEMPPKAAMAAIDRELREADLDDLPTRRRLLQEYAWAVRRLPKGPSAEEERERWDRMSEEEHRRHNEGARQALREISRMGDAEEERKVDELLAREAEERRALRSEIEWRVARYRTLLERRAGLSAEET